MLASFHSSVNDINNITSRVDDDEFQFEKRMRLLTNDELVYRQSKFVWKMMESELKTLDPDLQIVFLIIFSIIVFVAFFGNLLTIIVLLFGRKQRFLFKICLLSLAVSDFVFTLSTGSHYMIKLLTGATPLWVLGWHGCMGVPFMQTVSVLTGSMSLVLIALDRFLAVRNQSNEKLLQSKMFCLGVIVCVWLLGCGIGLPVLFAYEYIDALVIPNDGNEKFAYHGSVCITDPDESSTYYIIVFTFIFFPVFVGFIWLNTIISREIWKRRNAPGHSNQNLSKSTTRKNDDGDDSKDPSTLEMKNTDDTNTSSSLSRTKGEMSKKTPPNANNVPSSQTHTERQKRQMRMFKVILILMSVFICCRLPNWIFLFYKLKYNVSSTLNWILLYSFAALGLLNSMLNPFLYTFLNETIRITSSIANECQRFINIFCHRARYEDTTRNSNNRQMFANNVRRNSDGGIYLGS